MQTFCRRKLIGKEDSGILSVFSAINLWRGRGFVVESHEISGFPLARSARDRQKVRGERESETKCVVNILRVGRSVEYSGALSTRVLESLAYLMGACRAEIPRE